MSRIIVLTATVVEQDDLDAMDATHSDVAEAINARMQEFYPVGGNPVAPLMVCSQALDAEDAKWVSDGITIHAESQDDRDNDMVWSVVEDVLNPAVHKAQQA